MAEEQDSQEKTEEPTQRKIDKSIEDGQFLSSKEMFVFTSVFIGLLLVNSLQPGNQIPEQMKIELQETYKKNLESKTDNAEKVKKRGPLKPFIDMVPSNIVSSASNNRNMLQIVFVAILVGIGLIQIPKQKTKEFLGFFESLNEVVLKIIDMIEIL